MNNKIHLTPTTPYESCETNADLDVNLLDTLDEARELVKMIVEGCS